MVAAVTLPNDVRRTEAERLAFDTCPVYACHMGTGANIYVATITGPDGRQRTVWGCVNHLGLEVERALSGIRLEPFE